MSDFCTLCGNHATDFHHWPILESEGGTKTLPFCERCHTWIHSVCGHWQKFGAKGGKRTAQNEANWKRNLRQYKNIQKQARRNRRKNQAIRSWIMTEHPGEAKGVKPVCVR